MKNHCRDRICKRIVKRIISQLLKKQSKQGARDRQGNNARSPRHLTCRRAVSPSARRTSPPLHRPAYRCAPLRRRREDDNDTTTTTTTATTTITTTTRTKTTTTTTTRTATTHGRTATSSRSSRRSIVRARRTPKSRRDAIAARSQLRVHSALLRSRALRRRRDSGGHVERRAGARRKDRARPREVLTRTEEARDRERRPGRSQRIGPHGVPFCHFLRAAADADRAAAASSSSRPSMLRVRRMPAAADSAAALRCAALRC